MKLNQKQHHQLADVIDHFYDDEEKDCHEYPRDSHVFHALKALSDALDAYNNADCCMICGTVTNRPMDPSTDCGNPCEPTERIPKWPKPTAT